MKKFLLNILRDPEQKSPLELSAKHNFLLSQNSKKYFISNGIADLKPKIFKEIENKSQLHLDFGSEFKYEEHYELDAKVNDYFEQYECSATTDEFRRIHEAIIREVPREAELILDVGCGSAWVAEHFLKKGKKVISMDISGENPEKALAKYPSENHAGLIADSFHLPLADNSIDAIVASEIIEHVINPEQFVLELTRVLKPSGKLVITTPYYEKLEYQLCVHCNKPTTKHAHLHSFNENNIGEFVPKGFNFNYLIFGNKYLGRLRTHYFLGWMPFGMWRQFDKLASLIKYKPIRFLIGIEKSS